MAREASEGVERTRSRLDGSPAIDTRVGALSIDPTASGESVVASVAASADNLRSTVTAAATARRVFRDRCESHVHVAAVEACVGTACSLAGDPDTAVRFLARAVHFSPGSSAFRGELARVATYTSRGHAVTAAGCLVPAPSAQSVVTPTYTSPEACAIARYATVASTVHAAAACDCVEGWPVRDERRRDLARQGVPPVTVRDIGGGCVRAARPRRGPTRGGGRRWRWGPWESARGSRVGMGVRHQTSDSPRRVERRRRRRRWRAGTRTSPARRYAPRPSPRWWSARIRRWCTRDGARRLERGKDPSQRRRRRRRSLGAFGPPGTTRVVRLSSDRPSL